MIQCVRIVPATDKSVLVYFQRAQMSFYAVDCFFNVIVQEIFLASPIVNSGVCISVHVFLILFYLYIHFFPHCRDSYVYSAHNPQQPITLSFGEARRSQESRED